MAYPNCMFDVEEERFFGIEHKNASMLWYRQQNFNNGCKATPRCPDCPKGCYPYDTVSANQSTVARMAAALSSLATTNATGGWGGFLLKTPDLYGNRVTWNDIYYRRPQPWVCVPAPHWILLEAHAIGVLLRPGGLPRNTWQRHHTPAS